MAADPSVSPADTIRRVLTSLGLIRYGRFERPQAQEGLAALDALLAVGERDKAEIEALTAAVEGLLDVGTRSRSGDPSLDPEEWYAIRDYAQNVLKDGGTATALRESRERDRRQIATPQFLDDIRAVVRDHWSGLPEHRPDESVWVRLDAVLYDEAGQPREHPDYTADPLAAVLAGEEAAQPERTFTLREAQELIALTNGGDHAIIGDAVSQDVWDDLHERCLVSTQSFFPGDDAETYTTGAGIEFVVAAVRAAGGGDT